MSNPLQLTPNQKYRVVKPFTDYDREVHPVGETWTFTRTNFSPYEDGLSVHIRLDNSTRETSFRLQWREEEQAAIIENFGEYVEIYTG